MLNVLRRVFSFSSWTVDHPLEPPPGNMLDASFDAQNQKIAELEALIADIRRSDGRIQNGIVSFDSLEPQLKNVLGLKGPPVPGQLVAGGSESGEAEAWADTSRLWAEHMPDTIPGNSLAEMDISGDHWSSRWWAHQASLLVGSRTGGVVVSDTPPPDPHMGILWWSSITGDLHTWYIDEDSAQWVKINTSGGDGVLTPQMFGAIGDGVTDDTAAVAAAFASGSDIYIPKGDYKLTDMVTIPINRNIIGAGRTSAVFHVYSDFNMAAQGVIKFAPGESNARLTNLGIVFHQPTQFVGMTRADLIHYPPGIYADACARIILDNVRVTCGWDGVVLTGNSGGVHIGTLEVGCFNKGWTMDGALDWVDCDVYRFWAYGIGGAGTGYGEIYRDGTTVAAEWGRVDAMHVGLFATLRGNLVITSAAAAGVGFYIDTLNLDTVAQLSIAGGTLVAASGYSTGSNNAVHAAIAQSGGNLYLNNFKLTWGLGSVTDAIVQTSGMLTWNGGYTTCTDPARRVYSGSAAARAVIKNVQFSMPTTTRTVPWIETASNHVEITGNWVDEVVSGNPEAIKLTTDGDMVLVANNRMMGALITLPVSANLGVYGPNGMTQPWTPTLVFDTVGNLAPTYAEQLGRYWWDSYGYFFEVRVVFTTNAFTTASGSAYIIGLPALGRGISGASSLAIGNASLIDLDAGRTQIIASYSTSTASHANGRIALSQTGDNLTASPLTIGNIKPSIANISLLMSGYVRTRN